jgi:hypothetical protein
MTVPSKADVTKGVTDWLKLKDADSTVLAMTVAATLAYVKRLPVASDPDRSDDVLLGAVMLASRVYRRRNSPAGVEAITEGGAAYVARTDSDVSRLLGLDQFQRPYAN